VLKGVAARRKADCSSLEGELLPKRKAEKSASRGGGFKGGGRPSFTGPASKDLPAREVKSQEKKERR